jgi:hypothetical protein
MAFDEEVKELAKRLVTKFYESLNHNNNYFIMIELHLMP